MDRAFIGVGSNIAPGDSIRRGLLLLAREVRVTAVSTFYLTEPVARPGQEPFYNGVVEALTELGPGGLKQDLLRRIEERLGRVRTEDKHAPRTLDLDVVTYGELVWDGPGLKLPDQDIYTRPFIAVPLHELAPDLVLPDTGLRLSEVVSRFAHHRMRPLEEYSRALREEVLSEHPQG